MKKNILLFIIFMILVFLIPSVFSRSFLFSNAEVKSGTQNNENQGNNIEEKPYNYSEHSTIRLLHKADQSVEELPLDTYLLGVVSAEMPANFEQEALNAQALVARTYTLYTISKEDRLAKWEENLRDENWNKIEKAVNTTKGKVITYEGNIIDAFFHSNSGGLTETPAGVWGGTNYPYLQSVETAGEDAYSQYSSEVILTKEELKNKILESHSDLILDYDAENPIEITEYTESNRVKTIRIGNINLSGVEIRNLIGLRSTNFTFKIDGENIVFSVIGYGHGVGMSQTGADSMAKNGSNYEEIVKHFYTGVEIVNI